MVSLALGSSSGHVQPYIESSKVIWGCSYDFLLIRTRCRLGIAIMGYVTPKVNSVHFDRFVGQLPNLTNKVYVITGTTTGKIIIDPGWICV